MVKQSSINEQKTAAASYILTFYKEVQTLKHEKALYINNVVELNSKYDSFSVDKMEPIEKTKFLEQINKLRYSIQMAQDSFCAISESLKVSEKDQNDLISLYDEIEKDLIIKRDQIKKYVAFMNKFLIKEIIHKLIEDSQSIVNSLYPDDDSPPE